MSPSTLLEEEFALAGVHMSFVHPLVLSAHCIKGPVLQFLQLESEAGPKLLQAYLLSFLFKNVPVGVRRVGMSTAT